MNKIRTSKISSEKSKSTGIPPSIFFLMIPLNQIFSYKT